MDLYTSSKNRSFLACIPLLEITEEIVPHIGNRKGLSQNKLHTEKEVKFKMRQFRAGYIIDSISSIVRDNFKNESIFSDLDTSSNEVNYLRGLLRHTSTFDVRFPKNQTIDYNNINPVLATINNILTRGLPTKAPVLIEETFVKMGLIQPNSELYEFKFKDSVKKIDYATVFELLHIIEPDLQITKSNYGGSLGSHLEWKFIGQHPFLIQILQSQRNFATINSAMVGGRSVDFSFTSPYLHWSASKSSFENKTRIFEVDGPHHLLNEYLQYDHNRDIAATEVDAETYRFTSRDITKNEVKFEKLIEANIYKVFEKNFNRDISEYLEGYTLIFVPIAVARIQKTIIEYLILNPDLFKKELLQIAIIGRDIPGAALAIKSLQDYFLNINAILEEEDQLNLPQIELSIFQDEKWIDNPEINCGYERKSENFFGSNDFDLIIDHSILQRSDIYKQNTFTLRESIIIRSCHYVDNSTYNSRKVYCSRLLKYKELVGKNPDGSYHSKKELEANINYFIQNIFRKIGFREGQLPIISRALQQLPVIGLLPTGGGKSLTFQLPAFLQPGLCLVVDPIKSLMEDQVRVLKENWIDCCEFINSTISPEEKRRRIINFRLGESLFFFISPERFIMDDFRKVVSNIHGSKFGLGFSYCVIDEVHCVSEWGHDFRYTYLMLGINSQKFCSTRDRNKKVTLIGLTATASFDVLTDIERELQIEHHDVANAVIMIENTIRPELFFRIIDVTNKSRIDSLNEDFLALNKNLLAFNNEKVLKKSQLHHFEEFEAKDFAKRYPSGEYELLDGSYQFAYNDKLLLKTDLTSQNTDDLYTITFCSVKGTKQNMHGEYINQSGVSYVQDKLASASKGFYFASDSDQVSDEVQNHFTKFTSGITHHMVCTKAFGMGIDKTDIRSTYHYNYSSSLESFIQECGRAGRDQKIAIANILLDTSRAVHFQTLKFFEEFGAISSFDRNIIRKNLESYWENAEKIDIKFNSKSDFITFVKECPFSFTAQNEQVYSINDKILFLIKEYILSNVDDLLIERYKDRGIHNFFFNMSFKGIDYEKVQIEDLVKSREFAEDIPGLGEQPSLAKAFGSANKGRFDFTVNYNKLYELEEIKKIFRISHSNQDQQIRNAIKYAVGFEDFLFKVDENRIRALEHISETDRLQLHRIFFRDRHTGDTGRIIYRMHSVGFLVDYTYDYNKKTYSCTFIKHNSITPYIDVIEKYLRRYLSENAAVSAVENLKARLSLRKEDLVDDIVEALHFIAEFSYKEIVDKRKRATDDIENTLLKMNALEADDFEKNCFLKGEIYFYFNAKFARPGFRINDMDCSLLDDHKKYRNNKFEPLALVKKYLHDDIIKSGTEQNNYKHLIGSCKKIMQSLATSDLKQEWVLRLIKAFAMYATNNISYRSEANKELENGFINLFNDVKYHNNDFDKINTIFENYFDSLTANLNRKNESFLDIDLIKNNLLQQLQFKGIDNLINKFNQLENVL